MFLFLILMLTAVLLIVVTVTVVALGGGIFVILFGDVIVCIFIIGIIIGHIRRKKK